MNTLMLGLYAEGRTDERFLPIIIQRTSEKLLIQHDRSNIEANEPEIIRVRNSDRYNSKAERIFAAAHVAYGYHALVIHSDADDLTYQQAYQERFGPGKELLKDQKRACRDLIPIIPVRMVEAWMLADSEALQKALSIKKNFNFLKRSRQVESYTDPKDVLDQVIRAAYPDYPKLWSKLRGKLYAELAPLIRLELLYQVPAYREFVRELAKTFKFLNLIQEFGDQTF